jgi:hypothetical protein
MPDKHPFHSDDSFVKGENPIQVFVDAAHPVTEEERNRPRYGRPARAPSSEGSTQPNTDGTLPSAE